MRTLVAALLLTAAASAWAQSPPQAQAPAERPAGGLNLNLNRDDLRRTSPSPAAQDRADERKKGAGSSLLPELGGQAKDAPRREMRSGSGNPFPKDMLPGQP